ncbi:class I SAM-dependent methyltransferase [Pseudogemmobacter faecipullorum]|uniref:Ribosomal RNA small subunit methyltransferase J n=1 Tax=Pseudogemmobacter faecipullorum TaxID=2755041 RepID=A0ABS8CMQ5_9RHOB|nr:class I SAM-dependent methyltransferase [Pseudogemmobacter faecipullorum]MCB5410680.1 class I SAM-dependent methyltransferase [Pseudogemmobacter faecipullorum]
MSSLRVDYLSGAMAHRLKYGGGRQQTIGRAIGIRGKEELHVVDATAGLGRDAFIMASLGARVTLIERSEEMQLMLAEGLEQCRQAGGEYAGIADRMTLLCGDAKDLLPQLAPEVIYVDPMHPARKGSALVKLPLRQVREIVGSDDDSPELMRVALASARKRVVLKWPLKGAYIEGIRKPSHQILGKSTRYDVFISPLPAEAGPG